MDNKEYTLRFRSANRDIFNAIKSGKKKIETRAGTEKYRSISKGDTLIFVCGKLKFRKRVSLVKKFRSISAMLKKYNPVDINPKTKTESELEKIYHSFPGYRGKIKKYGLILMKLR